MPDSAPGNAIYFVNGAHFASFSRGGKAWRMASLTSAWPEELTAVGENPNSQSLEELAGKGIWLRPAGPAPALAVMCGGMGAAWPHMGRELYDNFPVCRAAMDKIASLADWDILSLMDEEDLEAINQTRLQIPYLFLLEFAQWSQFSALGLQPDLMSGHSIGELMALCFAGVYDAKTAWHILDTRAEHIASLEGHMATQGGMLAISGNLEALYNIMANFSRVRIANSNTPTQVILSGPREELLDIRRTMRKERIPALMLNMNLAFHHPAMRYLRDLSLRRLNALSMKPAAIPILSCSKAELYPDDKAGICDFIADLDENMVDWISTLKVMREKFKIRHWLELGPQEILCGLTRDNIPEAEVTPSSRKGREAEFMAQACARLYSLGLLDSAKLAVAAKRHYPPMTPRKNSPGFLAESEAPQSFPPEAKGALQILSSVSGKDVRLLRPDMDLRTDLAIRSSRFPYVIQELEKAYNKQVPLEILFKITTIRDLLGEFANAFREEGRKKEYHNSQPPHFYRTPPLLRWTASPDGCLKSLPFCESGRRFFPVPDKPLLALVFDAGVFPEIITFLGASGITLALPSWQAEEAASLLELGVRVKFFPLPYNVGKHELANALDEFRKNIGLPGALLFIPPPARLDEPRNYIDEFAEFYKIAENFMVHVAPGAWTCHLQRIFHSADESNLYADLDILLNLANKWMPVRRICWLAAGTREEQDECAFAGAMLADDFWNSREGLIIWKKAASKTRPVKVWTKAAPGLALPTRIDGRDWRSRIAFYQISFFQNPDLFKTEKVCRDGLENLLQSGEILGWGEVANGLISSLGAMIPWLSTTGISDLEFYQSVAIADGITREFRFDIALQPWMSQESTPTLMAYCEVFCRQVAANGRMLGSWMKIARMVPLLTGSFSSIMPVWNEASKDNAQTPAIAMKDFFKMGGVWHNPMPENGVLRERQKSGCHVFNFILPAHIADMENWQYKYFTTLLDFSIAALWNVLMMEGGEAAAEIPAAWRLASIGYIRFNWRLVKARITSKIRIFIGETWRQDDALRFNGQVESDNGELLMTFHSAEIEKRPKTK